MSDYLYADDGKIHTRYTELVNCTLRQIDRVLDVREGTKKRFENDVTDWGRDRHELWDEESQRTGKIPECFSEVIELFDLKHIEKEFATELMYAVVVHSRPDAVTADEATVIDYKTLAAESLKLGIIKAHSLYNRSKQLKFYAYQLGLHGMRIKTGIYLVEIWNKDYTEILGYTAVIQKFTFKELASILPWVQERVSLLTAASEEREDINAERLLEI